MHQQGQKPEISSPKENMKDKDPGEDVQCDGYIRKNR